MNDELKSATEAAAAKIALPVTVAGLSVGGWGVSEWMYAATILYIAMQGAYLSWKWRNEILARREARAVFRATMTLPPE